MKKLLQKRKNNKGFSLVELIVVVAIMAVLIGVLVPTLVRNVEKSKKQKDISTVEEVRNQLTIGLADEKYSALSGTITCNNGKVELVGATANGITGDNAADYIKEVCQEFRVLYDNIQGTTPYCVKRVAVLNCWGKMRSWGNHMVHHAIYYNQNYSYFGIIEALSGAPFDVSFISFDDIRENRELLKNFDVIINVGDADTAQSGGENWIDETVITAVKEFVYNGGGFIGVGEPAAHQWQGKFFQLDDILGVEEEHGFNLNTDKYNWEEHRDHFILQDAEGEVDFGEGKKNIYALPETEILIQKEQEVQMAVKKFGKGRGVYISGLPYSFKNSRVFYRAVLWSASAEEELHCWYSTNYNVEVHAYVKNGKYCVVNNTYEPQDTTVYRGDGSSFQLHLEANEIKWYQI